MTLSLEHNKRFNRLQRKAPLPFFSLAVGMLASYLPDLLGENSGISISYLGWIVPFLGCGLAAILNTRQVSFPIWIWLPWIIWVVIYLFFANSESALQRTVMLLTPLVVGIGFSTLFIDDMLIKKFNLWLIRFFWVFIVVAGISTGLLSKGQLNDVSGFAAGSITASLLATWYAARYAGGEVRALLYWAILALVPVLANTRTGMLAVALTLPLTLVPLSIKKRFIAVVVLIIAGLLVFQSERIQSKMFFSENGTLSDAVSGMLDMFSGDQIESGDFITTGRKSINDALISGLDQAYWFGNGSNTTEAISMEIAGVTHPHNDWLRVRYEYGMLGMIIFVLTLLAQVRHALLRIPQLKASGATIFLYVGTAAFISFILFMASDNVMLYPAWFGNLQFAMLGLGYAATRSVIAYKNDSMTT